MRRAFTLSVVALVGSVVALADTYVVLPDGTGDFPTIQAAIDAAMAGDVVLLSDGTFRGVGNRDVTFAGKAITVRSQGDSPGSCIIDCQASASDRHRGVIFNSHEGASSVLCGVTITNAYVAGSFPGGDGGGIYCRDSSPSISNCVLLENAAEGGGGALCYHGADPTFTDCVFARNRIIGAGNVGAGIYCYFDASPMLTRCVFIANSPSGISWDTGGSPHLEECSFSGHSLYGVFCGSEDAVSVTNCEFFDNGGPAIRGVSATVVISGCIFGNNRAANGGAILSGVRFSAVLIECLFYGNAAEQSGGVAYCEATSALRFSNCTMAFNGATGGAAAVDCSNGTAVFENTIVAFNTGAQAVQGSAALTCCDVFDNPGGDWVGDIADQYGVNGNISEDPLFCDAENFDFSLDEISPCAPFSPPNPECDLIGSEPVACGQPTACEDGPSLESTWGGVKALFRGDAK